MCHKGTLRRWVALLTVAVGGVLPASAQTAPDWRKVGTTGIELGLASPAGGPVTAVWFSPDGTRLYARTASDRIFQTEDFETWSLATQSVPGPMAAPPASVPARLPETAARVVTTAFNPGRIYALGEQLSRSDDGGHSWTNLSAYRTASIIGTQQHSLAVSERDQDEIVVANNFGVWRSLDGGLTWAGLNQLLPNLAVQRILSTPVGTAGTRVQLYGGAVLELPPGGSVWVPVSDPRPDQEAMRGQQYTAAIRTEVTAFAISGETVYAGTSDGRLFVSFDSGKTFRPPQETGGGRVERIFADPANPTVALAALGGNTGPHVLRTTNHGGFWDTLDGNLPAAAAHAVAADWSSGAVYVATDKGVFYGRADLVNPTPTAPTWTALTENLQPLPARDVRLDPAGLQLYMALDGYGVYAAAAPHRRSNLRVVNAADSTARPAAPGSLLSVIGGRVNSAANGSLQYPVLNASDNESQIQVPFEESPGNISLALQTRTGTVALRVAVQAVSPAILVGRDAVPALMDAETGMAVDSHNVAHSNGRVQIMATGLGKVRPDWPSGVPAPENAPAVAATVRAFLNGSPIEVTRATLAPGYIGFYLIEVRVPAITNIGPSELYITADGRESNRVQIVIEP